jgi:hypothetical protein
MSLPNSASAGANLSSGISVALTAVQEDDGSVRAHLYCAVPGKPGQDAVLTFTGTDILVDIPSVPAGS